MNSAGNRFPAPLWPKDGPVTSHLKAGSKAAATTLQAVWNRNAGA